jgi:PAS domain-containing protein
MIGDDPVFAVMNTDYSGPDGAGSPGLPRESELAGLEAALVERPLELILARNLVSIISIPAVLVDAEGRFVFFNEAAAEVMGAPFEEIGVLEPDEWNARYGPFDADGNVLLRDELPLGIAVRESRPAYGRLHVRGESGLREIETAALPLTGPDGYHGAIVVFWPLPDAEGG